MHRFAGVIATHDGSALLVQEPDFFSGVLGWTIPSGHVEPGESPVDAAARELAEESGCVVGPDALDLVAVAEVTHRGDGLNRSWTYAVAPTDRVLQRIDDDIVVAARWFPIADAVALVAAGSYAPKREPVVHHLTVGRPPWRWTFELDDLHADVPSFTWSAPRQG